MDRAALDVALKLGIPCGGWCPRGRRSVDGVIPAKYPLTETESPDYADRTNFTDPMVEHMLNTAVVTQADVTATKDEVNGLIDRLLVCGAGCASDRSEQVAKAACTAVLGSAAIRCSCLPPFEISCNRSQRPGATRKSAS